MTEENIWKIYNFVNFWKAGKYGIKDIETCASAYLHLDKEPIDEEKLDELARKETGCLDPTDVDDPNYCGYHCYVAGYRKAMVE